VASGTNEFSLQKCGVLVLMKLVPMLRRRAAVRSLHAGSVTGGASCRGRGSVQVFTCLAAREVGAGAAELQVEHGGLDEIGKNAVHAELR